MFRTYSPKVGEVERRWHVVDATDIPLGRLSTDVARLLSGKHKPQWAPHVDTGDFVIVVNAEKAILTGKKEGGKVYHRTSGRPGGLKSEKAGHLRQRRPTMMVEMAVRGMLAKGPLGRKQAKKLKVYAGPEHPHAAQQPQQFTVRAALTAAGRQEKRA
jgi:large subunit ribosomal protein L13